MSPLFLLPSCRDAAQRRRALAAAVVIPAVALGALVVAPAAQADPTSITTKAGLAQALHTNAEVVLGADLTGDGGADDALEIAPGTESSIDLNGHELDLDRITLGAGAELRITDTAATPSPAGLRVGTAASRSSDGTDGALGIALEDQSSLSLSRLRATAVGSAGRAGIGSTTRSQSSTVQIETGAVVSATGGSGGAGVGGGEEARPSSVSVSGARLVATGGTGGAGIGGGTGSDAVADVRVWSGRTVATGGAGAAGIGGGDGTTTGGGAGTLIVYGTVTAKDGGLTADAPAGTSAPSAIGPGQGSDTTGQIFTSGTTSIPAGALLRIPAGSEIVLGSVLAVAGRVDGPGALLIRYGGVRVLDGGAIDPTVALLDSNYEVTFDADGGTTDAATLHLTASDFTRGGFDLDALTGRKGDQQLIAWRYGTRWIAADTWLYNLAPRSSDGTPVPLTLTAVYGTPITFTADSLRRATLGAKYDQPLPVTGPSTATWVDGPDSEMGLSLAAADDEPAPLTGLPIGMSYDPATGHVSGYPGAAGHYTFRATAEGEMQRKTRVLSLDVAGAPAFATTELPAATAGTAYSTRLLTATDGAGGDTAFSVAGGSLPAGMALAADGTVSGTPAKAGTAVFGVKASNDFGSTKSVFSIEVAAAAGAATDAAPAPTATTAAPAAVPAAPAPTASATAAPPTGAAATTTAPTGTPSTSAAPSAAGSPSAAAPSAGGTRTTTGTTGTTPPVLPALGTTAVKFGHRLDLSVAASSTAAVTYSVPAGALPTGLALDGATGLVSGVATEAGTFRVAVTATSSAGSTTGTVVIRVAKPREAVRASVSAVTPKAGAAVKVSIRGLKVGERWHVALDGTRVQSGVSAFGGTVVRTVRLPRSSVDTEHVIRVSGDRPNSDPSIVTADSTSVTSVVAKKALHLSRTGHTFTVRGLAAHERVTLRRGAAVVATGRADDSGVFVAEVQRVRAGVHSATGSTRTRVDRLTVR